MLWKKTWVAPMLAAGLALSLMPFQNTVAAESAADSSEYRFLDGLELASPINKGSLSRFNRIGNIEPGVYSVDVYVNGNFGFRRAIRFDLFEVEGDRLAACLKIEDLASIEIRHDLISKLGVRECARLKDVAPGATADFDFSSLRLNVSVPQSLLNHNARGYVDPDLYDAGESIAFVNYSLNQYYSRTGSTTSTSTYGFTNSGINVGLWRLRQQGSVRYDNRQGFAWNSVRSYAKRALPDWHSEVSVGQNYTSGRFFSALGYQGIELSSDERMLPDSLRGYAPVVRGTARSNAQVVVSQKGRELYRTTVAPGNFVIEDLYPTSYNGDFDVTVIEADGSRSQFSVPFSALPESMRPGLSRYSLIVGRTRDTDAQNLFVDGVYQRGLSNSMTGNVGVRLASGYQAAALGSTWSGKIGAIGLNLNYSRASTGSGRSTGWMFALAYSRTFTETGTNFSIGSYRYSTEGYRELTDVQSERRARDYGWSSLGNSTSYQQHSRFDVSLSQQLGRAGSIYVSGLTQNFYNNRSRITQMQLGYTTMWSNGMSINLAFQRQQVSTDTRSDPSIRNLSAAAMQQGSSIMLSVSIPLGRATASRPIISNSFSRSAGGGSFQSQVSGMLDGGHNLSYSAGVNREQDGNQTSINGSVSAQLPKATVSLSMAKGRDYWQTAANARGAVTLHSGGMTFGPYLSDTFALVEAKGAEGAKLYNGQGAVIDRNGFALVPSLSPYRRNVVELSTLGINSKAEVTESQRTVIPYAGATVKLSFKTREGYAILIKLDRDGGYPVPMGADVLDEQGSVVGMVGQGSQAYLRAQDSSGRLNIRWGDSSAERCVVDYNLLDLDTQKPLLRLESSCREVARQPDVIPASASRLIRSGDAQ